MAEIITLRRTHSDNPDFIGLVRLLDDYLAIRDGHEHAFYHQFNGIDFLKQIVVAYENNKAIGCGAIKAFDQQSMEVKRMYTLPELRGKGIASLVLTELEKWTTELGFRKCILETGKKMPEAIRLYQRNGYERIPNYGQYVGVDNSVCMQKNSVEQQ